MIIFDKENFSKQILKKRTKDGWTLRELGGRLDISFSTLNRYERGITIPTIDYLLIICEWLDEYPSNFLVQTM